MSITQFAMVEELASLIKDNFPSRYLVLAVEEALVNYLQDDPSADGVLELEPMSSYNRLILHRLADIFGFAHESVGEGDDRHLILQRCLETSIPAILVSDILWQHDQFESSPIPYQLLRRDDTSTVLKMNIASSRNFLDREAAYLAARERIFGTDEVELKDSTRQKPRHDPIVARRMIAHALGQRINQPSQSEGDVTRHTNGLSDTSDIERKININLDLHPETSSNSSKPDEKFSHKIPDKKSSKMSMREENLGAAKRLFAHALGKQASKDGISRCKDVKSVVE